MKNSFQKVGRTAKALAASAIVFLYSTVPAYAQLISPADQPGRLAEATGGEGSFRNLILTFLNFFLGFLGLLAVVMVIYGGILYVTAAGEQDKLDKGKKIIMYAVVGIVIILLAFALVNTILGGLGAGQD
ncbi:pilin [Patescibacteria group bacterium]|nr:pilin [Patescibacteria group bacterium]MBU1953889.1 pilin [Patescibacteria group bacterium]